MDGLGMVSVVGVGDNRSRSTNLSGNLSGHRVALGHRLWVTHLLWNLPGDSMASCARDRDTDGHRHAVRSHHLSWSAHWHLVALSLRHLMADRFNMADSNRTCTDEVTIGRTHQLGVSISIGIGVPLAKSMTSVANMVGRSRSSMSMRRDSSMSMSNSMSRNCVSMMSRDPNCLADHRTVALTGHLGVCANFCDDIFALLICCRVNHRLSVSRTLLLLVASLLLHCLANLFRHMFDNSGTLGDAVSGALLLRHHIVGHLAVRDMGVIGPCITISSPMSSIPISTSVPRISISFRFRLRFSNWRPKCCWHNKKKTKSKLQTQHIEPFCLFLQSVSTTLALATSHADS